MTRIDKEGEHMSIRPLDMQIVVQKTQDIHPAKQSVVNKQDNELLQAQIQNKAVYLREKDKVQHTEKSELKRIRGDEEKHSGGRGSARQGADEEHGQGNGHPKNSSDLEPIGIHFDMKV